MTQKEQVLVRISGKGAPGSVFLPDFTLRIDASRLAELEKAAGESSIVAVEIPQRPYSDLLHSFSYPAVF